MTKRTKAINFNVNDYVMVRLTERGKKLHRENHDKFVATMPKGARFKYDPPKEDKRGWSKWQMWHLMQEFGQHMLMGFDPPFHTDIQIMAEDATR